jgi:tetratricopeptide (TPR) repeat protein
VSNAVRLAPDSPEALTAQALLSFARADMLEAAAPLRRARALSPGVPEVYELWGRILLEVGPLADGIAALEHALDLDPSQHLNTFDIARAWVLNGDWQRADEYRARLATIAPMRELSLLARFALWGADPALFLSRLSKFEHTESFQGPAQYVHAVAVAVQERRLEAGAEARLREVQITSNRAPRVRAFLMQMLAELHAFLGDRSAALRAIRASVEAGLVDVIWCDRAPCFDDELRRDSQFRALRQEVADRARVIRGALGST